MDAFVAARIEEHSVDAERKAAADETAAETTVSGKVSPPRTFAAKMRMKRAAAAAAAAAAAGAHR